MVEDFQTEQKDNENKDYAEDFEDLEDKLAPKASTETSLPEKTEELEPEFEEDDNVNPFVKKFQYFFDKYYKTKLEKLIQDYPTKKSLYTDFNTIEQYDPDLADQLIDNPEYVLEAMQLATQKYKSSLLEETKEFEPIIRVGNLPKDKQILIKNISSRHIGKFVCVEGIVKQFTTVLPKIKKAHWICKKCGSELDLHQEGLDFKKPKMCPECKHREFILDEKNSEFQDYQKLELQDLLEELKGGEQASTIHVYVSNDLVNTFTAGERLIATGILKLRTPQDLKQTVFGQYILCSSLESSKQEYETIEITKEDEERIKEFSKNPEIYDLLIDSVAPHIFGHNEVKEAIIMQLFGGIRKHLIDKSRIRGNIHVLIVGDPGTGKSKLLLAVAQIAPKSIYVAGKTASGAGLTATAVKDEFGEGGWTLKAGALVLANGGFAMIDEFDKMDTEDRSAMHEALEQESYHKDFEIMLSDGTKEKIGNLVDNLIEKNKTKIILGKDCELLKVNNLKVITTDFKNTFPIKVNRVSRHIAPNKFVEITYSNGRKITVTPSHPVFVFESNEFIEKPADSLKEGLFCPCINNGKLKKQNIINSNIGLVSIKKIQIIPNKDSKWVYDVTVEPTKTFITGGLVLHNTVSIAKAGIVTSFKTETTVLAAANPKYGRFDAYKTIPEQIEIPPTLMSRFDLFFVLQDIVDEKRDNETVSSILKTHKSGELLQKGNVERLTERETTTLEKISSTPALPSEFIQKYISYGRTRVFPVLTEAASKAIQKFFINLRQKSQGGRVTVTYRQLEALVRLSEASARVRLSETVGEEDAKRAIRLYKRSMEQVGLDPETGTIDIDIITTGQSHSQANRMMRVVEIIGNIMKEQNGQCAKIDTIVQEAEKEGMDKGKVKELVEKLLKVGDIYEPRSSCYMTTSK
ncbi:MAG: AAA family ATPase, partial [Candidatus Diapherotrites archaeon CG08_land_8_20_14_0_20_30_16]